MKKLILIPFLFACLFSQAQIIQVSSLQDITDSVHKWVSQRDTYKAQLNLSQHINSSYQNSIDLMTVKIDSLNNALKTIKDQLYLILNPKDTIGLKVYDWSKVTNIPTFIWPSNPCIPNSGGWYSTVEYAANSMISVSSEYGKSMHMVVDPFASLPSGKQGNFRSEIYLGPWHALTPIKTEQWISWSYYFPNQILDPTSEITLCQLHVGNGSPPIELWTSPTVDNNKLMLTVLHGAYNSAISRYGKTGITLSPGKYDFVFHVIWDTEEGNSGLTELWVNGNKVCSVVGGNTYSDPGDGNKPYGGTLKLGIYKYPWRDLAAIQKSIAAGVKSLELYIGTVKVLTRGPGNYVDGYNIVKP